MNNETRNYFININNGCNKLLNEDLVALKNNVKYLRDILPSKEIEGFTSDIKNTIEILEILVKQLQDKNLKKFINLK